MKWVIAFVFAAFIVGCGDQAGSARLLGPGGYHRVLWQEVYAVENSPWALAIVEDMAPVKLDEKERHRTFVIYARKHSPLPECFATTARNETVDGYARDVYVIPAPCTKVK